MTMYQTTPCYSCCYEIIPFRVIESSSEDDQYPASNLEWQYHHQGRGGGGGGEIMRTTSYQQGGGGGWCSSGSKKNANALANPKQQQHYLIIEPLSSFTSRVYQKEQEEQQTTSHDANSKNSKTNTMATTTNNRSKVSTIQIVFDENTSPVQSMEICVSSFSGRKKQEDDHDEEDIGHQQEQEQKQEKETTTTAVTVEVSKYNKMKHQYNHQHQHHRITTTVGTTDMSTNSSDNDVKGDKEEEDFSMHSCVDDKNTDLLLLNNKFKSIGHIYFAGSDLVPCPSMKENDSASPLAVLGEQEKQSNEVPLLESSTGRGAVPRANFTSNSTTNTNAIKLVKRKELVSIHLGDNGVDASFLKLIFHLHDGNQANSYSDTDHQQHNEYNHGNNNGISNHIMGTTGSSTTQEKHTNSSSAHKEQIKIISLMLLSKTVTKPATVANLNLKQQQPYKNVAQQEVVLLEGSSSPNINLVTPQEMMKINHHPLPYTSSSGKQRSDGTTSNCSNNDDHMTQKRINTLEQMKHERAKNEDFEAAAKIKEAIGIVQKYIVTVSESQEAMQAASENEDYLKASRYKAKRDKSRFALLETLDKIEYSLTTKMSENGSQDKTKAKKLDTLMNTHHKFDDLSLSTIRRVEEDEPSVLTTVTSTGPLLKLADQPILENTQESIHSLNNYSSNSPPIHHENHHFSSTYLHSDQDEYDTGEQHPLAGIPDFESLPTPEDINILEGRDEMGRSLSINNSHLTTDSMQKIHAILGSYCTRCLFSKNWSLREAALLKLSLDLQTAMDNYKTKNSDSAANWWDGFSRGLCMILEKAINDRIVQVFLTGLLLLDDCILQFEAQGSPQKEVLSLIGNLLIQLIEKLGDNNPKVVEGCETALMSLAFSDVVGPMYVGSQVIKLMSLSDPKAMNSVVMRCNLLQSLLEEFGNEAPSCDKLLDFIKTFGLKHKDADAREAAKELSVALFLRDGEEVLTLLNGMSERVAKDYQVAFLHASKNMKQPSFINQQTFVKKNDTIVVAASAMDEKHNNAVIVVDKPQEQDGNCMLNSLPFNQTSSAAVDAIVEQDITKKTIGRRGRGRGRRGHQISAFNVERLSSL